MSFSGQTVPQTVAHLQHGISHGNKREQTIGTYSNLTRSPEICEEWKKANLKRFHTVWFHSCIILGMTSYWNAEHIRDCRGSIGSRGRRKAVVATEDTWEIQVVIECPKSWPYPCQYPGMLLFCKVLPLGKSEHGIHELSMYIRMYNSV